MCSKEIRLIISLFREIAKRKKQQQPCLTILNKVIQISWISAFIWICMKNSMCSCLVGVPHLHTASCQPVYYICVILQTIRCRWENLLDRGNKLCLWNGLDRLRQGQLMCPQKQSSGIKQWIYGRWLLYLSSHNYHCPQICRDRHQKSKTHKWGKQSNISVDLKKRLHGSECRRKYFYLSRHLPPTYFREFSFGSDHKVWKCSENQLRENEFVCVLCGL